MDSRPDIPPAILLCLELDYSNTVSIHTLRKLGENSTGEKAGLELPRDDLRAEGLFEDGELVERPHIVIDRVDDGEWRLKLLDE